MKNEKLILCDVIWTLVCKISPGFLKIYMAIVKLFQIKWLMACLFSISWNQQGSGHELKAWQEPHTVKFGSRNWTKLMPLWILGTDCWRSSFAEAELGPWGTNEGEGVHPHAGLH